MNLGEKFIETHVQNLRQHNLFTLLIPQDQDNIGIPAITTCTSASVASLYKRNWLEGNLINTFLLLAGFQIPHDHEIQILSTYMYLSLLTRKYNIDHYTENWLEADFYGAIIIPINVPSLDSSLYEQHI